MPNNGYNRGVDGARGRAAGGDPLGANARRPSTSLVAMTTVRQRRRAAVNACFTSTCLPTSHRLRYASTGGGKSAWLHGPF